MFLCLHAGDIQGRRINAFGLSVRPYIWHKCRLDSVLSVFLITTWILFLSYHISYCGSRNSLLRLNKLLISKETTSWPTSCSLLYTQVFHSFHSSFLILPFFFFSLSSHSPCLRLFAWRTGLSSWSTLWYSSELVWNINQLHSLFSGDFRSSMFYFSSFVGLIDEF